MRREAKTVGNLRGAELSFDEFGMDLHIHVDEYPL
jgi:hypothetical protein